MQIQSALNRDVAMSTKVSIEDLDSIFRNTPALVKLHYDLLLKLEHINPHDHRAVIQLFADKVRLQHTRIDSYASTPFSSTLL